MPYDVFPFFACCTSTLNSGTQTEKRTGSVTVTFDGVDHSIIYNLTVATTHSEEGEESVTTGTVTFDGTECEYED